MAAVRACLYKSMCGHVRCAWACGTSSPEPLLSHFQLQSHYCPFSQKLMSTLIVARRVWEDWSTREQHNGRRREENLGEKLLKPQGWEWDSVSILG